MDIGQFLVNLCVSLEDRILSLISQQAEWEIPLHALLFEELAARGHRPRREKGYTGSSETLDLLIPYDSKEYAVEVKVESASRPGQIADASFMTHSKDFGGAITDKVGGDIAKVQRFHAYESESRNLVLLLAYTAKAQSLMEDLYNDTPPSRFGQGSKTFDHTGADGQGARNGKGSKLTVGLYYADYY
jgi:hypothetical protein